MYFSSCFICLFLLLMIFSIYSFIFLAVNNWLFLLLLSLLSIVLFTFMLSNPSTF